MGEGTRPRFAVELDAELVESDATPEGTRALVALETPDGPFTVEIRVPPDVTDQVPDVIREQVGFAVLVAVGEAARARRGPPTIPAPLTDPRIPHADRAVALAAVLSNDARRRRLDALHGPDWIRRLIESELAIVYADGERRGIDFEAARAREAEADLVARVEVYDTIRRGGEGRKG